MPPERRIRMLFDRVPDRIEAGLPMRYVATVTYRNDRGKDYEETYPLDLDARRGFKSIIVKGTHEVAEELEKIRRTLTK